jgi:hypothetical protein
MLVETEELTDENDRTRGVKEIQIVHELAEEWNDLTWEPEPIDASPGQSHEFGMSGESSLTFADWGGCLIDLRIPREKGKRYLEHLGRDLRF